MQSENMLLDIDQNAWIKAIERFNLEIKAETLKALLHVGYGHFGGCLSITEILACLYGQYLRHDPENPDWLDRDRLVLSKGHAGPALYATLALRGYFDRKELKTINDNGTWLPSHADMNLTPGIDMTTGSLGHGLSCAAGMAMGSESRIFVIAGDGELQEGQCWEAFQLAAHYKLNNLTVIVDHNKRQLDGRLSDIQDPFHLNEKFHSFGFNAISVDLTDDYKEDEYPSIVYLCEAIEQSLICTDQPTAIIVNTEKGQGCPSIINIENNHHLRLTKDTRSQINQDLAELEQRIEALS